MSFSPATYYDSRLPQKDKEHHSREIVIDHDVEEPLIRNRKELLILIGMAYLYLNANVGFAIIAPFLPIEVGSHQNHQISRNSRKGSFLSAKISSKLSI